jgi:hypothetical protein
MIWKLEGRFIAILKLSEPEEKQAADAVCGYVHRCQAMRLTVGSSFQVS